ncbi:uncharacterized protein JCM6883_006809 [Sporobolomyces salmoneus]|uniref:uncharacterized protein n=1 Tax=Sporobolomyces salmoneus TaxID=183962 RepID=UPI00317137E3
MPTSTPPSNEQPQAPAPDPGFWASLAPADQKKYTLVFLISLGTTLLVTGRSGGSLLKRAKKSEASAPASATPTVVPVKKPPRSTIPSPPPLPQPESPTKPTSILSAPPSSFLNPNELAPNRRSKRLLPSFTSSPSSLLSSRSPSSTSSYFLPNPYLTSASTAYATELDRLDKLHEDGSPLSPEPETMEDDGFNPAIYAAKALGYATLITFSTFGLGIWGVMKYLDVEDMEGLSLALSYRLGTKLQESRPSLPSWALPTSKPDEVTPVAFTTQDRTEREETEEEEMSYWRDVKETLDREAEERKRTRREKWEELRAGRVA